MNKLTISTGIFALFLSLFLPLSTHAQTSEGQDPWGGRDREEIRQWRERSSNISRKIDALGSREAELPVPILFGITPNNLSPNFGDPRSGGRTHEGLDIMAPKGAPIVSPTDAVVIRVGNGESSGYYVYTANPGGETFVYMHLDALADLSEGDELSKGDLIGYVGNTGNASGGATHLHFEIQDDRGTTDTFPRFKRIFPLADKIKFLENILDSRDDKKEFAELMVARHRSEFVLAKTLTASKVIDVTLPDEIETALKTVPAPITKTVTKTTATTTNTATGENLSVGSRGTAVVTLQKFLKAKNVGSASLVVADGSFGPITKRALSEYQASVGLTADGVYGPKTKAYIDSHS